jgi:membrane-associated phospholipid phosphatase
VYPYLDELRSVRKKFAVLTTLTLLAWLLAAATARAQDPTEAPNRTASSGAQADRGGSQTDSTNVQQNTSGPGATKDPEISWKHMPMRVLEDQKGLWLFPTQLARGRHWVPTLAITGVTGVLIATDPHTQPYFRDNRAFEETSEIFSTANTGIVELGVPATVYVVGLLRRDSYTQQTAMLAAEAYVDSAIPHVIIKLVSRRLRPSEVAPDHDFRDTFFRSHVTALGKGSSFPSGHAAAAFSIGTVLARRYGKHKWVPWVAYGVAGLISISRVPDMAHFPSDVFLGAALGYTITRFDVFRNRNR